MSEPQPARPSRESRETHGSRADRPKRPAPLLFEPGVPYDAGSDRFFELESMDDPRQLLARATELERAFRTAADRASEFQAIAAAQLTDPRRFDRITPADLAEQAGWTEDYARKMAEWGQGLIAGGGVTP
jgi:hypothetical protein